MLVRLCDSMFEQSFGTYGLLFCMKNVVKLILRVQVIVGFLNSQYAENSSQYAVSVCPD